MEGQILKHMGFQLSAPTAKSFLRYFCCELHKQGCTYKLCVCIGSVFLYMDVFDLQEICSSGTNNI